MDVISNNAASYILSVLTKWMVVIKRGLALNSYLVVNFTFFLHDNNKNGPLCLGVGLISSLNISPSSFVILSFPKVSIFGRHQIHNKLSKFDVNCEMRTLM